MTYFLAYGLQQSVLMFLGLAPNIGSLPQPQYKTISMLIQYNLFLNSLE